MLISLHKFPTFSLSTNCKPAPKSVHRRTRKLNFRSQKMQTYIKKPDTDYYYNLMSHLKTSPQVYWDIDFLLTNYYHRPECSLVINPTFSSSCLNPIIYGFTSRNFRQSYLSELRRCCLCCPHPGGHPGGRSRHGGEGNPAGVGMRLLRPPAPAGGGGRNDSLGNTLCVTSAEGYRRGSKSSRISQTSF